MGVKSWVSSVQWRLHIVDFILYLSVLCPVLISQYGLYLQPMNGSFRCSDPSIQLPYRGDTVSTKLMLAAVIVPVFLIMFLTELFHVPRSGALSMVRTALATAATLFLRYWVALTGNIVINLVLKTLASTPRPHFIDTCRPDWSRVNCTENGGYVRFDLSVCQEEGQEKKIFDAMKSFPSGHAQLSCFAAVFIIVYVGQRVGTTYSRLWGPWLQLLAALLAAASSLSRISDSRHHPVDVLAGAVLGTGIALLAARGMKWEGETEPGMKRPSQGEQFVKQKRPSKMRLLNSEFGSVVDTERELREVNPNPAC